MLKLAFYYSRLSGGSAQSDVLPSEKKKKKSIFGKLKKLTKSRSVDDHVENAEVVDFRPIGTVSQVCYLGTIFYFYTRTVIFYKSFVIAGF